MNSSVFPWFAKSTVHDPDRQAVIGVGYRRIPGLVSPKQGLTAVSDVFMTSFEYGKKRQTHHDLNH